MPLYKMKGKKDGLQRYRVRINYTDRSGVPRQIERIAYGLEQAKALEHSLLREAKENPSGSSATIQELFEEYIEAKKHEVRTTTLDKASHILSRHVVSHLGDQRLSKLTPRILQDWKITIEEKNLSLTMRKNIYTAFQGMLGYAIKMDYLVNNPLKKVGNFKDAYATKAKVDYYTAEEFLCFLRAAETDATDRNFYEWNFVVFFCIAFYTGLRKGEIYALKWSDIDGDLLHVTRSIAQHLPGGDQETPPKNQSSVRDLQLPAPLRRILQEHRSRYAKAEGFNNDWRICGGPAPIRDSSVVNHNVRYATLAGIKKIRLHDFRHSHASLLANEGINIQEIARRLGHSKIEITWNTYSHLYPREEERAVEILNRIQ